MEHDRPLSATVPADAGSPHQARSRVSRAKKLQTVLPLDFPSAQRRVPSAIYGQPGALTQRQLLAREHRVYRKVVSRIVTAEGSNTISGAGTPSSPCTVFTAQKRLPVDLQRSNTLCGGMIRKLKDIAKSPRTTGLSEASDAGVTRGTTSANRVENAGLTVQGSSAKIKQSHRSNQQSCLDSPHAGQNQLPEIAPTPLVKEPSIIGDRVVMSPPCPPGPPERSRTLISSYPESPQLPDHRKPATPLSARENHSARGANMRRSETVASTWRRRSGRPPTSTQVAVSEHSLPTPCPTRLEGQQREACVANRGTFHRSGPLPVQPGRPATSSSFQRGATVSSQLQSNLEKRPPETKDAHRASLARAAEDTLRYQSPVLSADIDPQHQTERLYVKGQHTVTRLPGDERIGPDRPSQPGADPAAYTRLPPSVWVYKYSHRSESPSRETSSLSAEAHGKRGSTTERVTSLSPLRGRKTDKDLAFPLEVPTGHQQADYLYSCIPTLLQFYDVPSIFTLRSGAAILKEPIYSLARDGSRPPRGYERVAARTGSSSSDAGDDCKRVSACSASPSSHESVLITAHREGIQIQKWGEPGDSGGLSDPLRTLTPGGRGTAVDREGGGPLGRGLRALQEMRAHQEWWNGLMTTMDVTLYELYRQLRLFAPFHARCVEMLHQQLTQYADIHRTASLRCLADFQASLLKLQEKVVLLRQQKEQQDSCMQGLEAQARHAEELRRLLDIHTHLFGLQELEALTVRQSEEEATAADWQWQKLLERLEEIRFGRDDAGTSEVWLTRRTGEWAGREDAAQAQQSLAGIIPSVVTLLPHETFLRGVLDETTNARLLRVDVPPGRWSIGLAVTCSAPLDVSLLLLFAERRESPAEKIWTLEDTRSGTKDSPAEARGQLVRPCSFATAPSSVPTLDPSLRLTCADRPQFSSFASFRVHPQEPQVLHARTPPLGTPHGGWLLIRVQRAHATSACLLQEGAPRCGTEFADQVSVPSPRHLPPIEDEPRRSRDSDRQQRASPRCVPQPPTSARPGDAVSKAAEVHLATTGKDVLRFSISVHVVYLHPCSSRSTTARQCDKFRNRRDITPLARDAEADTGDRSLGDTGARKEQETEDRGATPEEMGSKQSALSPLEVRKQSASMAAAPQCRVLRNACVQTRKSKLLRGAIRNLHEGPRPPPVPQFCSCSETCLGSGFSETRNELRERPTSSQPGGPVQPTAAVSTPSDSPGLDPVAPKFYAPSFPIFRVLLDETPVPLGDFAHLLQQGSHAAADAAAAPGVMTATNFPRWPPQLLAETAWVILLQRARERQWLGRTKASKERGRRRKVLETLQQAQTQVMHLHAGQPQRRGRNPPRRKGPTSTKRKMSPGRPEVPPVLPTVPPVAAPSSTEPPLSSESKPVQPPDDDYTREPPTSHDAPQITWGHVIGGPESQATATAAAGNGLPLPESFWEELHSAFREEVGEEGSLASFAFGFFLRRFNVAFLALKALHSFVLSLLYWSPLLASVSAKQQKVAACSRNTRPNHSSIFAFGENSSLDDSGSMSGSSSGQQEEHAEPQYNFEQRQQTEIDSQVRGFSPLFATQLFGRITGLLAGAADTAPFRRALEDFSCLALTALVDQVAADQAAYRTHQLKHARLERQQQALPTTDTIPLSSPAGAGQRSESQPVSFGAGASSQSSSFPPYRVSQEEGLCLAVTHAAAAKIARRVFNEEGTTEYRLAVLTAINLHRQAAVAAERAAKKPRLRSRWARGILVITGRDRIAEKPVGEKERLVLRGPVPGPQTEEAAGSLEEPRSDEGNAGLAGSHAHPNLKSPQGGWNLLLPVDLLVQVMAQQWEVLYVHLQQAMEMVLDKEVSAVTMSPLLSLSEFTSFLQRLNPGSSVPREQHTSLYCHALVDAASRLQPVCSCLTSTALSSLLLHQSHLLSFPLPFPKSPFLSLGAEPMEQLLYGELQPHAGNGTTSDGGRREEASSTMPRGTTDSTDCDSDKYGSGTISSDKIGKQIGKFAEGGQAFSSDVHPLSPPAIISSPSYECRLAAFIVDGLVNFVRCDAPVLLSPGKNKPAGPPAGRSVRRDRGYPASQAEEKPSIKLLAEDLREEQKRLEEEIKVRQTGANYCSAPRDGFEGTTERDQKQKELTGGSASGLKVRNGSADSLSEAPFSVGGQEDEKPVIRGAYELVMRWYASPECYQPLYASTGRSVSGATLVAGSLPACARVRQFVSRPRARSLNYLNRREALQSAQELDGISIDAGGPAGILLAKLYLLLKALLGVFNDNSLAVPFCYAIHSNATGYQVLRAGEGSGRPSSAPFVPTRGRLSLRTHDKREVQSVNTSIDPEALRLTMLSVWRAIQRVMVLLVKHAEQTRTRYQIVARERICYRAAAREALAELARLYRDQVDRLLMLSLSSEGFSIAVEERGLRQQLLMLHRDAIKLEQQQLDLHEALHASLAAIMHARKKAKEEQQRMEEEESRQRLAERQSSGASEDKESVSENPPETETEEDTDAVLVELASRSKQNSVSFTEVDLAGSWMAA
ncbi:hypothetical protein CSUI_003620 [Cystoisospora suis]|uniref:Uncharacterized protein n=1 Tax=Cystoisospora suis TaxID=483139 RepID=A0A2C6L4V9_9APIC|nr:hypothetical protein CSUI_003620 [Cystoisospora suis]